MIEGMHTDMPVKNLGQPLVQRCRKIWWTVYILDRQMTSLMGLPQSIRDEDITCQLPDFEGSARRATALDMQIKLARIYAEIARSMWVDIHLIHAIADQIPSCLWFQRSATQEVCPKHQGCFRWSYVLSGRTPTFIPAACGRALWRNLEDAGLFTSTLLSSKIHISRDT